jgi:hypothetical protein
MEATFVLATADSGRLSSALANEPKTNTDRIIIKLEQCFTFLPPFGADTFSCQQIKRESFLVIEQIPFLEDRLFEQDLSLQLLQVMGNQIINSIDRINGGFSLSPR